MLLYKYKASTDPETNDWLGQFANFVAFLRRHDIHPVFVFEGKAPPEKCQTQKDRKVQRQKMAEKTIQIEKDLQNMINHDTITSLLTEIYTKRVVHKPFCIPQRENIPRSGYLDISEVTAVVKEELMRRKRYDVSISSGDIEALKELLRLLGVSYVQSEREAETDCVAMFYDGLVDYVMSEDSDVLAYHDPKQDNKFIKVICDFDIKNSSFTYISKKKVLKNLNLTSESFRDFCIMCGTDYNKNIPRIGVQTAFKLVSKHNLIEKLPIQDISILNHERIRQIFEVTENLKAAAFANWCKITESSVFFSEMDLFTGTHKLRNVNVQNLYTALSQTNVDWETAF
jgi:5'-3' exonuclease